VSRLVGSEMCIRDSGDAGGVPDGDADGDAGGLGETGLAIRPFAWIRGVIGILLTHHNLPTILLQPFPQLYCHLFLNIRSRPF
jgi:hypothetical protein